ncbi:MAG: hypothetical protein EPN21_18250 [Methylococcaceae bacterium]|nr:MAG: hypothetical protein EPN21_18250 [Methylococcaceae bacterium]
MLGLTPLQCDTLTEMLNIGVAKAAVKLGAMVHERIELSVPLVHFMPFSQFLEKLRGEYVEYISGVKQSFQGGLRGKSLVLFPDEKSLTLVRLILQGIDSVEDNLNEIEEDAISEVGNIILNSCLATFADAYGMRIKTSLPEFIKGSLKVIDDTDYSDPKKSIMVMFISMKFQLSVHAIDGFMMILFEIDDLKEFTDLLDAFVENLR